MAAVMNEGRIISVAIMALGGLTGAIFNHSRIGDISRRIDYEGPFSCRNGTIAGLTDGSVCPTVVAKKGWRFCGAGAFAWIARQSPKSPKPFPPAVW